MTKRIAVIDFPPEGGKTSWFVVNDAEGKGGLVARIEEHDFGADLIDFRTLTEYPINPEEYAAVFFASGFTQIRDYADGLDSREINPDLKAACDLYDRAVGENIPVTAFTHGSQILAFYKGGNYFKLKERNLKERTRKDPFGKYKLASSNARSHWIFDGIAGKEWRAGEFSREYRAYGVELYEKFFRPLLLPDDPSTGPAIAVHEDPAKFVVLFMMHPEYYRNLPGHKLMGNVLTRIGELYSARSM